MQTAVRAKHAVAGNHNGHRVGGIGSTYRAHRARFAETTGYFAIGRGSAVGNGDYLLQDITLKRAHDRPVYNDIKGISRTIEIGGDLFKDGLHAVRFVYLLSYFQTRNEALKTLPVLP